jgi:hypothetical protein
VVSRLYTEDRRVRMAASSVRQARLQAMLGGLRMGCQSTRCG